MVATCCISPGLGASVVFRNKPTVIGIQQMSFLKMGAYVVSIPLYGTKGMTATEIPSPLVIVLVDTVNPKSTPFRYLMLV